jgi:serine/threonine-protein kinase
VGDDDTTKDRGTLRFATATASTQPAKPSNRDRDRDRGEGTVQVAPGAAGVRLPLDERYTDAERIGRGGMGSIYSVQERTLFREVAMKVQHGGDEGEDGELARLRFIEEAQINGQLEHPNIVPVYELGQDDDGVCYFTIKRVRCRTLGEMLRDERVPENRDALYDVLEVLQRVCDALSFAHSRGVIHRDLKPSNIMVGDHGQVYLMDWGIALVLDADVEHEHGPVQVGPDAHDTAAEGTVIGTLRYMAPEQASGQIAEVDTRSDVFALGAILYRVLTGRPPYAADEQERTLKDAQTCTFPAVESLTDRAHLPPGLSRLVARAMSYEPAERFQSVKELKDALEEVRRGRWRFPTVSFQAGETILREGEHGAEAYIIGSGRCRVFRMSDGERQVLRDIGPGEVFGETAVFTNQPRSAFVEALDDVVLWVVSGQVLTDELGLDSWRGSFVRSVGERFSEGSQRLGRLERDLAVERCRTRAARLLAGAGGEAPLSALRRKLTGDAGFPTPVFDEALAAAADFERSDGEDPVVRLRVEAL